VLLAAWNASNNEPTKLCATRDVDHPESVRSDASVRTKWARDSIRG
jgi:hypothetical protein